MRPEVSQHAAQAAAAFCAEVSPAHSIFGVCVGPKCDASPVKKLTCGQPTIPSDTFLSVPSWDDLALGDVRALPLRPARLPACQFDPHEADIMCLPTPRAPPTLPQEFDAVDDAGEQDDDPGQARARVDKTLHFDLNRSISEAIFVDGDRAGEAEGEYVDGVGGFLYRYNRDIDGYIVGGCSKTTLVAPFAPYVGPGAFAGTETHGGVSCERYGGAVPRQGLRVLLAVDRARRAGALLVFRHAGRRAAAAHQLDNHVVRRRRAARRTLRRGGARRARKAHDDDLVPLVAADLPEEGQMCARFRWDCGERRLGGREPARARFDPQFTCCWKAHDATSTARGSSSGRGVGALFTTAVKAQARAPSRSRGRLGEEGV